MPFSRFKRRGTAKSRSMSRFRKTARKYGNKRNPRYRALNAGPSGRTTGSAKAVMLTRTREILWGHFDLAERTGFAAPALPYFTYLLQSTGGQQVVAMNRDTSYVNKYTLGINTPFSFRDLPTDEINFINNFEMCRIIKIEFIFRPANGASGSSFVGSTDAYTGIAGDTFTTGSGVPRLYLHTEHDQNVINGGALPTQATILSHDRHTVMDINSTCKYSLIPSTQTGLAYSGATVTAVIGQPEYKKWLSTTPAIINTTPIQYNGLSWFIEWNLPPASIAGNITANAVLQHHDYFYVYDLSGQES